MQWKLSSQNLTHCIYPLFASVQTSLGCHEVVNYLFVNTPSVCYDPCNFAPFSVRHFVIDIDHFVLLALVTGEYTR